jgi:DNA-binding transcriptional ArsR family regulator
MHAFDVLGDPVRRRILELLAGKERPAGDIVDAVHREFGISQAAVSQHLKVLRESGFARMRAEGQRRLYSAEAAPLESVDRWLGSLTAEIARGKRERRKS